MIGIFTNICHFQTSTNLPSHPTQLCHFEQAMSIFMDMVGKAHLPTIVLLLLLEALGAENYFKITGRICEGW